jgi:hypothetical protein
MKNRISILFVSVLLCAVVRAQSARFTLGDDAIHVNLDNGASLSFLLSDGWLLGLGSAELNGTTLTSGKTVQRPLVAQEFMKPGIWPFMKLRDVEMEGDAVRITVELFGGTGKELFMEEFVFAPDRDRAMGEEITPELEELRYQAVLAMDRLNPLVKEHPSLERIKRQLEREQAQTEGIDPEMTWDVINNQKRIERFEGQLSQAMRALYDDAVETESQREALAAVKTFEAARDAHVANTLSIHRDFYAFAHLRQPSETCQVENLLTRIQAHGDRLQSGGTLTWVVRPHSRNIAGWVWNGWSQQYEVSLKDGHQVNNIRQIGTWEIGGRVPGLTLVALRYRGLGGAEETMPAGADGESAGRAWSTTEIMAGAAGRPPAVSPVIPPAAGQTLEDRGYALRHRLGAWISKPGRGAGAPFVDFQSRDGLTLISSFEHQGAHRAVTEVFPGDRHVSQIDEQWFANTSEFETKPQLYLALRHAEGGHEMTTRWQEVDQHFRDVVAENLDFVQVEPLPGIGWLDEHSRPARYRGLAEGGAKRMIERGMRMIVTHTPGWYTEQHRNGPDQRPPGGGNSNRVFDWVVTEDVKADWKRMTEVLKEHQVPYFIYLGGMVRPDGPFARAVGTEPEKWGMNLPGSGYSHGYPPLVGHNLYVPETRERLTRRLMDVQETLGMNGVWSDSFQNMYMSQLNWGDGSGAPMQAVWWPTLADWSRNGIHLMSESHAFPGLSCSIELPGWEESYPYFQYVWKWMRGTSQNNYTPEQIDHMGYRFMANKSWVAPDWNLDVMPSFTRYSNEYMAALPSMRRSWVLAGGAGVLWLPFDRDDEGILFSFAERMAPDGVTLAYILDEDQATDKTAVHHTYRVRGENLPVAFGMAPSPQDDPRSTLTYAPVEWDFPE